MDAGEKVYVDLGGSNYISPGACLMLCAEIKRGITVCGNEITGCDRATVKAREVLHRFGFHEEFGFKSNPPRKGSRDYSWLRIKSGKSPGSHQGELLAEVASLTSTLWNAPQFENQVHVALSEAMTNISGHAYKGADPTDCMSGQWWVAGITNKRLKRARFYAYDQGVGVPCRSPATMLDALRAYWTATVPGKSADELLRSDREILRATIEATRRELVPAGGTGLPTMIDLVAKEAVAGSVHIVSRRARYRYSKEENDPPGGGSEECHALREPALGTLVAWELFGPIVPS
jgi:hypothetical protein